MINLIPPQGQRVARQEYMLRVTSTFFILFGILGLFLTVAYIPTYVLITAQMKVISAENQQNAPNQETARKAENEVQQANNIVAQLKALPSSNNYITYIEEILKTAPEGISFKTFTLGITGGVFDMIQVQGTASTRETLSRFKTALEATDMFTKAEVPIADLVRETNLPFVIAITVKQEK